MYRAVLYALLVFCLLRPSYSQDSILLRPYRFDESQEYILPFYMQKKTLSEKMRSVKNRVTGTHMRDTLFG